MNALLIAGHYEIPEVCAYFNNHLFRGNRVTKTHANSLHAFTSPNHPPLMTVGVDMHLNHSLLLPPATDSLSLTRLRTPRLASLALFPGLSAHTLQAILQQPLDGLVLQTYGAGNGPTIDEDFLQALETASHKGTMIVNCTQCLHGSVQPNTYETGTALTKRGVLSAHDMTHEATLTKLLYLLSQDINQETARQIFQDDLRGELTKI